MLSIFRRKTQQFRVGLQLSDDSVSVLIMEGVIGEVNDKKPVIKESIRYEITEKFSLGNCRDALKSLLKKKGLENLPCYCVLSEKDYQLLLAEPPEVPEHELQEAMRWRIRDLISFNIEDAVIDVFPQPGKKSLYTVVTKRTVVKNTIEFVSAIGLSLVAIDISELSYRNFLEQYPIIERGIALMIVRENEGKLLIVKQGNLYLSRRFTLNYGAGVFDELPEDDIILELQRSLDYYERQIGQMAPAEILFAGHIDDEKITPLIRESFQQSISCVGLQNIQGESGSTLNNQETILLSGAISRRKVA